jgi:hypothetical protein
MLRLIRNVLIVAPLLLALYIVLQPGEVTALPLFARKYSVPCTTCHFAYPRLNKFGMDFRQRGYRMAGEKGESPWESKEVPLSLIGNVGYTYQRVNALDSTSTTRSDYATSGYQQNAFELHSAGTLAPNATFHLDADFDGVGGALSGGMVYVQFDDLVRDGALNIKTGIFDADIPYLADSRKTTLAEYQTAVTLDGQGVELNGTRSGWTYAAGLINSARTIGKPDDKSLNNMENTYLWLMRDVKGHEVTVRWYADHEDPRKPDARSSLHTQVDASAFLDIPHAQIIPGYTYEKFADPDAETPGERQTGMLEALVQFGGGAKWLATARYELQHASKTDFNPVADTNAEVLGLAFYPNPNLRLAGEWSHGADNVQGPRTDTVSAYVLLGY